MQLDYTYSYGLIITIPWASKYTILYYTILYYTILYYTILYYTILYYTILYYTILYYTILYYTILYYTILYYTILYYTILYYTILYYTAIYYNVPYTILYFRTSKLLQCACMAVQSAFNYQITMVFVGLPINSRKGFVNGTYLDTQSM